MINSEKSGIMFTINPVTNDENEIIIEAGFGLGDAIVSGAISPNRYVVDKILFQFWIKKFLVKIGCLQEILILEELKKE